MIAALAFVAAQASSLPPPTPTPRDLYVSCFLVVQGNDVLARADGGRELYSAGRCLGASLLAIANREGRAPGQRNDLRFCLPDTIEIQTSPPRAMAAAYVDWYERVGSRLPQRDYAALYIVAMIDRWPCR